MSYRLRNKSAVERFWFAVVKRETGCWLYRNRPEVYGNLKGDDGKTKLAHRFSFELHNGPIPRGMFVCHKCDTPGCVNPDHLYVGTHEDNNQDMIDRDRRRTAACQADKLRRRAMDSVTAEAAKQEYETGMFTMVQLAKKYSCSQATISAIIRGVPNYANRDREVKTRRTGNFRSKITAEQREEIRQKYAIGSFTQTQLAVEYGITQTRVSDIITGRDYRRSSPNPEILQCP